MITPPMHSRVKIPAVVLGLAFGITLAIGLVASPADADQAPVGLGTAASFAVLAHTTVTNTGPSTISGDLGVSPGTAVTGFPPGIVISGTQHVTDAVAAQAQLDVTTAYNDAAGRLPVTSVSADLTGQTLAPGVYGGPTLGLTGTVTLDAQNNPAAVFVFKAASTLITATSSVVALTGGATACNVYWQVGSSATLGTNSTFVGSVMALASVTANTGATISGRLLARTGAVTLDDNTITKPTCTTPSGSSTSGSNNAGSSTPATGAGVGTNTTGASTTGASTTGASTTGASTTVPGAPLRSVPTTHSGSTTSSRTTATSSPPLTTTSVGSTTPGTPPRTTPPALTGSNLVPTIAAGLFALTLGGLLALLGRRTTASKHVR
jgi:hypothetical protein